MSRFPSLSFSRFELRTTNGSGAPAARELSAGEGFLENERLRVEIDGNGDIARLFDKLDRRELLAAPVGLEIRDNFSDRFPSWEIRWEDTTRPARTRIAGPTRTTVVERGPARVALAIERGAEGSRFVQTIALAAGAAGDQVVIDTAIDWRTDAALLKMVFPLSTPAERALFDQGVGVARRPVATAQLYEVPAHQWAALRAEEGTGPGAGTGAGAAIANDCKYGWDHPTADTLRLTLLHTPRIGRRFRYQQKQDFGHHTVRVAIAPIRAGESLAGTVRFAERLNQPLHAFVAPPAGTATDAPPKPKSFSFLDVGSDAVAVQALKLAEDSDELILRLRETAGASRKVELLSHLPILQVREVDGCERPLAAADGCERPPAAADRGAQPLAAAASAKGGARKAPVNEEKADTGVAVRGFGLAAVALNLESPLPVLSQRPPQMLDLALPWGCFGVSSRGERARDGGLDGRGRAIPRELLPRSLRRAGVELDLAHAHRAGEASAVLCTGQRISIPAGFTRLVLLAAAFPDALAAEFVVDGMGASRHVASGFRPLGRFDELERNFFGRPTGGVTPGYLRPAPVALAVPHRHERRGRLEACSPVLFFTVELAVSPRGSEVVLPDAGRLVVLAATLTDSPSPAAAPAGASGSWGARGTGPR